MRNIEWPGGKRFAFTIIDDPDSQSLACGQALYGLLAGCGMRTTRGVWALGPTGSTSDPGVTCADPGVIPWLHQLQRQGFELGFHNATSHTSDRGRTIEGLERFKELFGAYPDTWAQHYFCDENLYWTHYRLTGPRRMLYRLLTAHGRQRPSYGHVEGHPLFWGDIAWERVRYVRNFVFGDIDTLRACPMMPYHDSRRPYVRYWFAASDGNDGRAAIECLAEANQDRLEEAGGACVLYTHFGLGFYEDGAIHPRFEQLIRRLSRKNGWFVPVRTLLDFLAARQGGPAVIGETERAFLETRWLWRKIRHGTT